MYSYMTHTSMTASCISANFHLRGGEEKEEKEKEKKEREKKEKKEKKKIFSLLNVKN